MRRRRRAKLSMFIELEVLDLTVPSFPGPHFLLSN